jgi:phage repressor protein C with HTH and peptisase S24 domain
MKNESAFTKRLLTLIDARSVKAVAAEWGVPHSSLQSYLNRGSEPTMQQIVKIANGAKVRLDWLVSGDGPRDLGVFDERLEQLKDATALGLKHGGGDPERERAVQEGTFNAIAFSGVREPRNHSYAENIKDMFWFVPRISARASAGGGMDNPEAELSGALAFRKAWIKQELRVQADKLYVIEVTGNSMEPTLYSGDVVLIDTSQREVMSDGVFVLRDGVDAYVKRLQRLPGGTINAISDNAKLPNFVLTEQTEIIGRVIWRGGRI